jgi:hypothetical protein
VDVGSKFPWKEMLINVLAEDAGKASNIYVLYLLNSGKCKPKYSLQHISWYTKQAMDGTHGNIEGYIIVVECSITKININRDINMNLT